MKKNKKKQLEEKGWSKEKINQAEKIIEERKHHDKSRSDVHLNRVLFWSTFFVIIIGNILISFILIPILLTFNSTATNIFAIIIGFFIGLLFNFLVWDIEEHLTKKHHLMAAITIPILAILNLFAISKLAEAFAILFQIKNVQIRPLTISAFYIIAFLLPYLWTLFYKRKIKPYKKIKIK